MRKITESDIRKELKRLQKQEDAIRKAAMAERAPSWKEKLEEKVPGKVTENLKKAFVKAFEVIFEQGTGVIEKSYKKDEILLDHEIREYAVQKRGGRRELRRQQKSAGVKDAANMLLTTVEGAGLGLLGIGLPDIVIFIGMILKGIYETALNYGYDYEDPKERLLILKMMELSLLKGPEWEEKNAEVNRKLFAGPEEGDLKEQIRHTAEAFAMDMMVLKFVQGLPVIGVAGGLANPVYYRKILRFVRMKYQKRYLMHQLRCVK